MERKEITVLLLGDTGAGKSTFANYYLGENVFEENDNEEPVTTETVCKSTRVNGCQRYVIDTVGFNNGQSINSVQIQNITKLMRSYKHGINVIAIILNGQYDRFSQGVKNIIQFAYNIFGTKEAMNNMCIVFTKCYSMTNPKRETKQIKYRNAFIKYLSEISGTPLGEAPKIPIFFVDCKSEHENIDSKQQLNLFHAFACVCDPLSTKISRGIQTIDDVSYELFEDQKRTEIVPNNKDHTRCTEKTCVGNCNWNVNKETIDGNGNANFSFKNRSDGNIIIKTTSFEPIKLEIIVETKIETRKRVFERKEVCHHSAHSLFGKSSSNHTHYIIYLITQTIQRTVKTDFDGKKIYSDWLIVPGSENKQEIRRGMEVGYYAEYEKEILNYVIE